MAHTAGGALRLGVSEEKLAAVWEYRTSPLYSAADEALWKLADSYAHMGPRFADKSAAAYARIVKEYPLSPYVDEAKTDRGKLILNAIVWTAGVDVPAGGVPAGTVTVDDLLQNHDEPIPADFNKARIQAMLDEWNAKS